MVILKELLNLFCYSFSDSGNFLQLFFFPYLPYILFKPFYCKSSLPVSPYPESILFKLKIIRYLIEKLCNLNVFHEVFQIRGIFKLFYFEKKIKKSIGIN